MEHDYLVGTYDYNGGNPLSYGTIVYMHNREAMAEIKKAFGNKYKFVCAAWSDGWDLIDVKGRIKKDIMDVEIK